MKQRKKKVLSERLVIASRSSIKNDVIMEECLAEQSPSPTKENEQ